MASPVRCRGGGRSSRRRCPRSGRRHSGGARSETARTRRRREATSSRRRCPRSGHRRLAAFAGPFECRGGSRRPRPAGPGRGRPDPGSAAPARSSTERCPRHPRSGRRRSAVTGPCRPRRPAYAGAAERSAGRRRRLDRRGGRIRGNGHVVVVGHDHDRCGQAEHCDQRGHEQRTQVNIVRAENHRRVLLRDCLAHNSSFICVPVERRGPIVQAGGFGAVTGRQQPTGRSCNCGCRPRRDRRVARTRYGPSRLSHGPDEPGESRRAVRACAASRPSQPSCSSPHSPPPRPPGGVDMAAAGRADHHLPEWGRPLPPRASAAGSTSRKRSAPPVIAAAAGEVRFTGTPGSNRLTVSVRTDDGFDTSYLHLGSTPGGGRRAGRYCFAAKGEAPRRMAFAAAQ